MEREPTDRLASVRCVVFAVLVTDEVHDRPRAEHRVRGLGPRLGWREAQKRQEHKRRSFVTALRVHAERFEDYPRIFHSLIGGLAQLAHAAINSMIKKSTSTWDAAPLRPSSRSAVAVGNRKVRRSVALTWV